MHEELIHIIVGATTGEVILSHGYILILLIYVIIIKRIPNTHSADEAKFGLLIGYTGKCIFRVTWTGRPNQDLLSESHNYISNHIIKAKL